MKKIIHLILAFAFGCSYAANCNTYGTDNWSSTRCSDNGYRQTWDSYKSGNTTVTKYRNNQGTRGTSNQYNYTNGDYTRTYKNNNGYKSTVKKVGNCFYFKDNAGNRRSSCY